MVSTSLPEIPKPSSPPGKAKNLSFRTRMFREKIGEKSLYTLLIPFLGPIRGEFPITVALFGGHPGCEVPHVRTSGQDC